MPEVCFIVSEPEQVYQDLLTSGVSVQNSFFKVLIEQTGA